MARSGQVGCLRTARLMHIKAMSAVLTHKYVCLTLHRERPSRADAYGEVIMNFLHWLGSQWRYAVRPHGRVRDDEPADEVVQSLFGQIRQGGPTARGAWVELAEYFAQQKSDSCV